MLVSISTERANGLRIDEGPAQDSGVMIEDNSAGKEFN